MVIYCISRLIWIIGLSEFIWFVNANYLRSKLAKGNIKQLSWLYICYFNFSFHLFLFSHLPPVLMYTKNLLSRIRVKFHMPYSGFLFRRQLTWGTPAGKREECSFKGKNLEVRGTFLPLQQNKENGKMGRLMTGLEAWIFLFTVGLLFLCSPLRAVSLLSREDKMSSELTNLPTSSK